MVNVGVIGVLPTAELNLDWLSVLRQPQLGETSAFLQLQHSNNIPSWMSYWFALPTLEEGAIGCVWELYLRPEILYETLELWIEV